MPKRTQRDKVMMPADFAHEGAKSKRSGKSEKKKNQAENHVDSSGIQVGYSELYESDRRKTRTRNVLLIVVVVVLTAISLTFGFDRQGTAMMVHYSPLKVLEVYGSALQIFMAQITHSLSDQEIEALIMQSGAYYDVTRRFLQTATVLACGVLISVAGMLFQLVFRNPIASPTILGVQSGVRVGELLMAVMFGSGAVYLAGIRFLFSYIGGVLTLLLVFMFGKFTSSERGTFEIKNMLLAGVMLSQLYGVVLSVFSNPSAFPDISHALLLVSTVQERTISPVATAVVVVTAVVTMVPIIRGRFKYNLLTLSEEEMKVGGLNPMATRAAVLVCGSLMILASQAAIGAIAMVSLVVPFLARALYGMEFRKQLVGCALIGMALILVCYILSSIIPFVGGGVSMAVIASVILVPLYAWIMATNERALEL